MTGMHVLAVNAGSSSLKLSVIGDARRDLAETRAAATPAERAARRRDARLRRAQHDLGAVGHRIVHGGAAPAQPPSIVDDARPRATRCGGARSRRCTSPGARGARRGSCAHQPHAGRLLRHGVSCLAARPRRRPTRSPRAWRERLRNPAIRVPRALVRVVAAPRLRLLARAARGSSSSSWRTSVPARR